MLLLVTQFGANAVFYTSFISMLIEMPLPTVPLSNHAWISSNKAASSFPSFVNADSLAHCDIKVGGVFFSDQFIDQSDPNF